MFNENEVKQDAIEDLKLLAQSVRYQHPHTIFPQFDLLESLNEIWLELPYTDKVHLYLVTVGLLLSRRRL